MDTQRDVITHLTNDEQLYKQIREMLRATYLAGWREGLDNEFYDDKSDESLHRYAMAQCAGALQGMVMRRAMDNLVVGTLIERLAADVLRDAFQTEVEWREVVEHFLGESDEEYEDLRPDPDWRDAFIEEIDE